MRICGFYRRYLHMSMTIITLLRASDAFASISSPHLHCNMLKVSSIYVHPPSALKYMHSLRKSSFSISSNRNNYATNDHNSNKHNSNKSLSKSSHSNHRRSYSQSTPTHSSSRNNDHNNNNNNIDINVRINKCLLSLSRRAADDAISQGRVTINGQQATTGARVVFGDEIRLDGKLQQWESIAAAKQFQPSKVLEERDFVYVKYWKPRDVTCTSDPNDRTNILSAGNFHLFPQRLFTVGRLDKDSTGMILLTSDGRVNNAILSPRMSKEKVYEVSFQLAPTDDQVEQLRNGVMITTPIQRDGVTKLLTAKTSPCRVKRINSQQKMKTLEFTLTEGRNRQIRRMAEAVGLQVVDLHRTSFCGIGLRGLSEGNWAELNEAEMDSILKALQSIPVSSTSSGSSKPMNMDDQEIN